MKIFSNYRKYIKKINLRQKDCIQIIKTLDKHKLNNTLKILKTLKELILRLIIVRMLRTISSYNNN